MPLIRLRRLRKSSALRDWVSQAHLQAKDFILPYFIVDGKGVQKRIESMPGVYHLSIDRALKDIDEAVKLGIQSILLFGISGSKDESGSPAYKKNGVVQKAVECIRRKFKGLTIITDVCLCGYTSHGHCGVIRGQRTEERGQRRKRSALSDFIDNDETIKILRKIALSHAESGADLVGPSAMMDGQVKLIREGLDKNGFKNVGILAYSAKYASNFYGPFREAFGSRPKFGDRKSYQMDYRNKCEALREIQQDINEGADIIMVKPALAYLDIVFQAKDRFNVPIAAYNVSGEYSMAKIYCRNKETERDLVLEILTSIKRAGSDFIITYHAKEAAKWLK